jgi:hypothetical protein
VTIQDLGSVGELIAAIATVATLAYLALQIRQNTQALRHSTERSILEDANSWRDKLIQHSEIADLYRKGLLSPESLDRLERLRFRMLLDSLFDTWQYSFQSAVRLGGDQVRYIRDTLALPGGAQYWSNERDRFAPGFAQFVDDVVRSLASDDRAVAHRPTRPCS